MTALSVALTPAPLETRTIEERVLAAALSGLTPNSCRVYTKHLKRFLHYANTMGHPLSRETVERFISTVAAGSSYNQALSAIKRLAMQAAAHGWIDYPTAMQVASLRTRTQRGVRGGNWLTLGQARALLNAPDGTMRGKRDKAVLALLLGCGLRREELAKLDWHQIQLRDGKWMLIDIKGKGGRIRTIGAPVWVIQALNAWEREACPVRARNTPSRVVRSIRESGKINGSLSATAIWDIVLKYAAEVGVTCTPHDLRRTFAKLARKGGAQLEVIQKSLGHASIRTTEIYTTSGEDANAGDYLLL